MKRMKGKKKIILPKNQFNVGFPENFAKIFYKKIFSTSVWKRKRGLVI